MALFKKERFIAHYDELHNYLYNYKECNLCH